MLKHFILLIFAALLLGSGVVGCHTMGEWSGETAEEVEEGAEEFEEGYEERKD